MNIIRFHNRPPQTPFAPLFEYLIYENDCSSRLDLTALSQAVLSREQDYIKNFKYTSDWGTDLGADSMTSRMDQYNLLEWPEAQELKAVIKQCHNQFLTAMGLPLDQRVYAQCWANVVRKSQQIAPHAHYSTNYAYLGGHLCVQVNNTATHYLSPYTDEVWSSNNLAGKLTLFPNWVRHYTDANPNEEPRITIAWDMITEHVKLNDVDPAKWYHWIML